MSNTAAFQSINNTCELDRAIHIMRLRGRRKSGLDGASRTSRVAVRPAASVVRPIVADDARARETGGPAPPGERCGPTKFEREYPAFVALVNDIYGAQEAAFEKLSLDEELRGAKPSAKDSEAIEDSDAPSAVHPRDSQMQLSGKSSVTLEGVHAEKTLSNVPLSLRGVQIEKSLARASAA
mmetsp:Transcript_14721/g.32067  ORF Transcript_14721/g.32067 Transcript_14721/m.32067 type:complete len:181 (-) Transcript_14721:133-675(-)